MEIINGSSVTLKCLSSGFPPPQFKWTRGIKELWSNGRLIVHDQSLTITDVQPTDASEYTCTASNQFGQDEATTELVIAGAQHIQIRFCPFNTRILQLSDEVSLHIIMSCTLDTFGKLFLEGKRKNCHSIDNFYSGFKEMPEL